jgi:putative DNA primase/helicase
MRTADEILHEHGIRPPSNAPGRYYTLCPKCSAERSRAHQKFRVLGITIDDKGVQWGCNHCDFKGGGYYNGKANGHAGASQFVAQYPYTDESGTLLFEVCRKANKTFPQRAPDGKWSTKGIRKVLYRLPELIEAIKAGQVVLVVEGEKDVNAAWKLGVPATCSPGGASDLGKKSKWRPEYSQLLRGADIVILPDHDAPGYAHAVATASMCANIAKRVRILKLAEHWPECPKGGDLSDWLAAGHTREQLNALIEQALPPPPIEPDSPSADGGLQDNLALQFADQHAADMRYVSIWNRWLQYNGMLWEVEQTLGAFDEARKLCRQAEDADAKTVAAVITLARSDRRLAATADQWDADPWVLGTSAGTMDLRTAKLRPASPDDYITKITTVAPGGDCPLWREFLARVTAENEELQKFLQRMCGYALTGNTSEEALFFLYGIGANGKSVFIRTVAGILGEHHKAAPMDMFTVSNSDRHPTDLAMLRGARLVTATETEEGKRWDEAKIKALTGGDRIPARFMRQDFFEYVPQFKLLIAGNHRPAIRTVDEAIRRRMNLIPFTVTIPKQERDLDLSDKLKAEGPGILAWMIEGCLAWQRDGLQPPEVVTAATKDYLTSQDVLQSFLEDCCVRGPQYDDSIQHIWAGWKAWAIEGGEYVGTKQKLADRLEDKGYRRAKVGGVRKHLGIWCMRETLEEAAKAKS